MPSVHDQDAFPDTADDIPEPVPVFPVCILGLLLSSAADSRALVQDGPVYTFADSRMTPVLLPQTKWPPALLGTGLLTAGVAGAGGHLGRHKLSSRCPIVPAVNAIILGLSHSFVKAPSHTDQSPTR